MLLVDSTVWIDYFNGRVTPQTDYLDRVLSDQMILVGDLILAEVLQGYRSEDEFEQARQALGRFTQVSLIDPGAGCAQRSQLPYPAPAGSNSAKNDRLPDRDLLH